MTIQPAPDRHQQRENCEAGRTLLAQHDQGIGGIGDAPPLRVVVGLELPGLTGLRQQDDLAALEPPLRRVELRNGRIAFRLEEDLEIVRPGFRVGQRQPADRLAVAAHDRPVADHLVHRLRHRAGGGEILQDVDALALPQALEDPGLDLGEVDHGFTARILQADDVETPDAPRDDILGEGQRGLAGRLQLELEALSSSVGLERDDAGLAALGGRELPLPGHLLLQGRRILRMRSADRGQVGRDGECNAPKTSHQRPLNGVSATGVSGALPENQDLRLSTTSWSIALRVTTEAEPICGSSTTFCMVLSSSGTFGSAANTSRPAARMVPDLSAWTSAGSSITEPRATLTSTPRGPSAFSTSALIILLVLAPPGTITINVSTAFAISIRSG